MADIRSSGTTGIDTPDTDLAGAYTAAMNQAATAVTVISTTDGARHLAQTVSAVSTVSNEPPALVACVSQRSPLNEMIAASGSFRVNILGTNHDHVADTFAGRPWAGKQPYDFSCGDWELEASAGPRLTDAVVSVACDVMQRIEVGTHYVYIGAVQTVSEPSAEQPLVYLKRIYRRLEELPLSEFPQFPEAKPPYERTRTTR